MAHFHKHPGLERISGQTLNVQGESITVGLWGYKDNSGQDLIVTQLVGRLIALTDGRIGDEYPHTWAIPNYTLYAALKSI